MRALPILLFAIFVTLIITVIDVPSFVLADDVAAPTNFELSNLGAITIRFDWDKGIGANYTMIRGSIDTYPDTITKGELVYYGISSTYDASGYALDVTNYKFSAWGFIADNITHSANYATASIGGTGASSLDYNVIANSLSNSYGELINSFKYFALLIVMAVMLTISIWKREVVILTAAGIIIFVISLQLIDEIPSLISITFSILGIYLIFEALRLALMSGGSGKGLSQFKGIVNKVKGWF